MPAMQTTLTEYSDSANSRTFSAPGHSVQSTRVLIQKRKTPVGVDGAAESSFNIVFSTLDAEGNPTRANISMNLNVRYPRNGQSADVTSALDLLKDLVQSDEFSNAVNTQSYIG